MSRDMLTVDSTMRIPLLYRGEYSQWVERFMNYLEEQTDGEAMINSIKNEVKRKLLYLHTLKEVKQMNSKKTVVVTSDPLALIAKKTDVNRSKEKVVVSSNSEGSEADDFNDKKVEKKVDEIKRDVSKVKCYNCKKEGHFANDCKKAKVKDYEYYKTKMLLAKKDKDEQVLLAEDQAWMESSSDSDQEINANMVFMAQIKKVLSDSEASSSSADEKISEVSYYLSESESESENFRDAIESASKIFIENHINSQKDYNKSDVDHNDSEEKDQLVDKLIRKFKKKIVKCQKRVEKANQQSKDFENQNKDLQDKYDVLKNQTTTFEMNNKELNEQLKELIEKNNDLLAQTKVLKDQLQVKLVVIGTHDECQEKYAKLEAERYEYMIRYSAYFDNDKQHRKQIADQQVLYDKMSVQLVELDKHVRDLKNTMLEKDFKIYELEECFESSESAVFELENQNENDCYKIQKVCDKEENPEVIAPRMFKLNVSQCVSLILMSKSSCDSKNVEIKLKRKRRFKSSETVISESKNQKENDCLVVEKECDNVENSMVIAPGMFKLNVSQCVSPISMSKSSCDSTNVEIKLKTKRRKRKSSKQNVKQKKKGSSNTPNVGLSAISVSNLNKNVKGHSRKDLLACNNSHLGETTSASVCNDAMNVSCNLRMCDLLDDNNFFIYDDVNVKISPVSKMPFRKKPRDSMN
nr:hypothetical protein [Tanacetum cinerariifolium]